MIIRYSLENGCLTAKYFSKENKILFRARFDASKSDKFSFSGTGVNGIDVPIKLQIRWMFKFIHLCWNIFGGSEYSRLNQVNQIEHV